MGVFGLVPVIRKTRLSSITVWIFQPCLLTSGKGAGDWRQTLPNSSRQRSLPVEEGEEVWSWEEEARCLLTYVLWPFDYFF